MTKQQMVDALVRYSIESALNDPQREWLKKILAEGLVGFNDWSEEQLIAEMQVRGLLPFVNEEADEEEFENDDELLVNWSQMVRLEETGHGME